MADRIGIVALAVAFGLWHWLLLVRHPVRTGAVVVYWVGTAAFTALLAGYGWAYTILLYGLYPLGFETLGWWGMVPVVGLTALVGWRLDAVTAGPAAWLNLAATAGLAAVVAVVMFAVDRQNAARRDALEALAATRAELADTSRRAGVLEERHRMAREMHDTVAQGLTSIVTHLEAADQALDGRPDLAADHLATARSTARDGLTELRRSVHGLRPDALDGTSLAQALRRTANRWSSEHGVPAQVRVTGTERALHPGVETALLRIAQESLQNAARHAGAGRVVVTLSFLEGTVTLDVDDDGVGFSGPPTPRDDGGLGLTGMRERVSAVGGRLDVESAPGEGTTVAASVPA